LVLGFLVSSPAERIFQRKDSVRIVIDEAAGMFLSLVFLHISVLSLCWGFILFRIFDVLKVYPADRFQHMKGGLGVMLDDIVAGIYTNLILQVVLRLAVCSNS
jgi:phosphatidylglycerophosphatase A